MLIVTYIIHACILVLLPHCSGRLWRLLPNYSIGSPSLIYHLRHFLRSIFWWLSWPWKVYWPLSEHIHTPLHVGQCCWEWHKYWGLCSLSRTVWSTSSFCPSYPLGSSAATWCDPLLAALLAWSHAPVPFSGKLERYQSHPAACRGIQSCCRWGQRDAF